MANVKYIKVPPHNEDAETSVLGALFIDKNAVHSVSEFLTSKDFYSDRNNVIYEVMQTLSQEGKPIDILTVTDQLKKKKVYDKIGSAYLADLVNAVPTAANVLEYAMLIKEAATKRSLITAGSEIAEISFKEDRDIKEILDKAQSSIFSIAQGYIHKGFLPIKQILAESLDRIDELHKKGHSGVRGVRTGFVDLDTFLSGMQESNLLILAARPGQGKTAMAVNIAQFVAVSEKLPVGIFSLEMSQEELVDRLLVGQADVDAWKLKTGRLSESDFSKLSEAMGILADAKIFIDDTPGLSISEMRTKARRLQLEHDVRLILVDYLQLVDPGKRYDNRVQEVSIVSQQLKNLARELKIPVLAISQLSRAVEHRGEKKPQLADLRESGAIEQDADVVMFLYRSDDVYTQTMPMKLLIAKHRNGPVGEIELLFRGDRVRFYNVEKKREDILHAPTLS
ncbi:MAG: replicative DNA helicase [Candidatus Levybacteria bacterium]|nr:replicative DNA helicase [Candidatus Levybacteria bacterium]